MNKIFTCWRSTKIPLLSLSLAVLACLPFGRGTIASPLSPSPKQPSKVTKIVSVDRPPALPTGSKSPKNLVAVAANSSPVNTLKAQGTASGVQKIPGTVTFKGQPSKVTKIVSVDRQPVLPIGSKSPKNVVTVAANTSPVNTLKAQGTASGRSLQIQEISGTVMFKGRPAVVGDRLLAPGDEIITSLDSTARLAIDNNTGIVEVAEKTAVKISSLSAEQDTAIFVSRGRVRLSIGKTTATTPTAKTSTIIPPNQIASLNTFSGLGKLNQIAQQKSSARTAPVRVETPEGVAGVRGTSFGVSVGPDGKTAVSTIEGAVGVSGRTESEVVVNGGNATAVFPQIPPAEPSASPRLAQLKVRSLSRVSGNIYSFKGQVNPIDLIYVNDEPIKIDRQGKFSIQGTLPPSRRLKIVVRGPSVTERHYSLVVP